MLMVAIKCTTNGFLVGFDAEDNPVFGSEDAAIPLLPDVANELRSLLESPHSPTIDIVERKVS
jgi:hypothetical protein